MESKNKLQESVKILGIIEKTQSCTDDAKLQALQLLEKIFNK